MERNHVEKFVKDLSALSKKHGLWIGGCGCCGSPWVTDDHDGERQYAVEILRDEYTLVRK